MKTAVVFEGPGFSEQGDVLRNLGFAGVRQVQKVLWDRLEDAIVRDVQSADHVILRGPWSVSPEERLLSCRLAERLRPALKLDAPGPSILAVGRGALVVLELIWGGAISWKPAFREGSRWIRLRADAADSSLYMALALGRAVPILPETTPEGRVVKPWLKDDSDLVVAWNIADRIWISAVDILAYAERSQLPDFGYSDLTPILTQGQVLERFVSGEGS